MERLKNIWNALMGTPALPKTFRNLLTKYGSQNIKSIAVKRTPLSNPVQSLMNAITLGKWKEIKQGYDKVYHLYAILTLENGKRLLLEKNERPVLSESIPADTRETEGMLVSTQTRPIPLEEFITKTVKQMSLQDYITYNAFSLNCQDFIRNHLRANGLLNPALLQFVYQDIKKLVEKTPSFSQWLAKKATDIAGAGRQLWEETVYKRGGMVRRRFRVSQ
jgi:hypothetical protein